MKKFFRFVIIILNLIVAAALILACLCSFINPKTIWWIGFFGLAYMYLLALNICFLFIWIFSRKKKTLLISLIPILIGWTFVGRNIQLFEKKMPEDIQGESFKVISFNVHGFSQRNTEQSDGKMLNMFDFFRETDADIICMQEFAVNLWKQEDLKEENVRKQLGKTPYYHVNSGVAIFSKYPIIRKELVYSDGSNNICMCSDLLIGSDTVRVYNVHLKSVGLHEDGIELLSNVAKEEYGLSDLRAIKYIIVQMRASSISRAKQVDILSQHIEKSPYPVIICGDFNDPPISYSYNKVRGKRKDAFVEAGSGISATYHIGRIASLRIDNILHSDVFKAYNYESPRVHLSDHFPVMCNFYLDIRNYP